MESVSCHLSPAMPQEAGTYLPPTQNTQDPVKETLNYYHLFLPSRSNNSVNGRPFACEELTILMCLNDKE